MLQMVNKSPFERNALESCLRVAPKGSAILLLEDGVYGALGNTLQSEVVKTAMKDYKFYVLGPDCAARGLSADKLIPGITTVGYDGFVDLVCESGPVQSWL